VSVLPDGRTKHKRAPQHDSLRTLSSSSRHPELVSGTHHNGNQHDGYLAGGMLKQVQHDGLRLQFALGIATPFDYAQGDNRTPRAV